MSGRGEDGFDHFNSTGGVGWAHGSRWLWARSMVIIQSLGEPSYG